MRSYNGDTDKIYSMYHPRFEQIRGALKVPIDLGSVPGVDRLGRRDVYDKWNEQVDIITKLGLTNVQFELGEGTYKLERDLTLPSTVTLKVKRGAILEDGGGKLIVSGHLEAGPYQWISTSDTGIDPPLGATLRPEWWGADNKDIFNTVAGDPGAAADSAPAFQKMFDTIKAKGVRYQCTVLLEGQYRFDSAVVFTVDTDYELNMDFVGVGSFTQIRAGAAIDMLKLECTGGGNLRGIRMANIWFNGRSTSQVATKCLELVRVSYSIIENVLCSNMPDASLCIHARIGCSGLKIVKPQLFHVGDGIHLERCSSTVITDGQLGEDISGYCIRLSNTDAANVFGPSVIDIELDKESPDATSPAIVVDGVSNYTIRGVRLPSGNKRTCIKVEKTGATESENGEISDINVHSGTNPIAFAPIIIDNALNTSIRNVRCDNFDTNINCIELNANARNTHIWGVHAFGLDGGVAVLDNGSDTVIRYDDVVAHTTLAQILENKTFKAADIGGHGLSTPWGSIGRQENLLVRSEDFSTSWTNAGATISADFAEAPDGLQTADRMEGADGSDFIRQDMAGLGALGGRTFTASVWVKDNGGSSPPFRIRLTTLTAGAVNEVVADSLSTVEATGEWVRYVVSGTISGGNVDTDLRLFFGEAVSGDGARDWLMWGAQVTETSGLAPYTKTVSTAITTPFYGYRPGLFLPLAMAPLTYTSTMSGNETFTQYQGSYFLLDPNGSDRNFDPSGTFRVGTIVNVKHTGGANTVTFDSGGIAQAITTAQFGEFIFDGTNWTALKVS